MYVPYCRAFPGATPAAIGAPRLPVLAVVVAVIIVAGVAGDVMGIGAHIGLATIVGIGEQNSGAWLPYPGLADSGEHVLLSGDELPLLLKHADMPTLHGLIIGIVCSPLMVDWPIKICCPVDIGRMGTCCPIGVCCPMGICWPIGTCCPMGTCCPLDTCCPMGTCCPISTCCPMGTC